MFPVITPEFLIIWSGQFYIDQLKLSNKKNMIEKKRCNAASQKPLKSTFTLLFCVGDIKPSCFYSANHWWIVHVNYWFFLKKSTTLNLRQMDSTGRRYLNDRLFCMCVFQDLFQVGEIIEAPSHAKLEVVQSWTLSPLTSQRPRFNHFPSRRCVQVVLGNARLSLPPVFPPDVSWMKSHLIQMNSFRRRKVAAFMCLMDFLRRMSVEPSHLLWTDEGCALKKKQSVGSCLNLATLNAHSVFHFKAQEDEGSFILGLAGFFRAFIL